MNFQKYRYHLFILLAGMSYSSLSIFFAMLTKQGVAVFSQVLWRAFLGAIFSLIIFKIFFKEKVKLEKKDYQYIFINAVIFVLGYTTYAGSIYLGTPMAKAIVLAYSYPIAVVILSYLLFKEIPKKKNLLALILSFCSLYILLEFWKVKSLLQINKGDLLAWLNSFCYGGVIVWGTKMRREIKINPCISLFYTLLIGIPILFILGWGLKLLGIGLYSPVLNINFGLGNWLILIGLGFFGTTLPVTLMYFGMTKLKSYVTSVLLLTEPVFVYLFGLLFFGQTLSLWTIIGGLGILVSVLLV